MSRMSEMLGFVDTSRFEAVKLLHLHHPKAPEGFHGPNGRVSLCLSRALSGTSSLKLWLFLLAAVGSNGRIMIYYYCTQLTLSLNC